MFKRLLSSIWILSVVLSSQIWAQSTGSSDIQGWQLDFQSQIDMVTPNTNDPKVQSLLGGLPLIQGDSFQVDRDQFSGPGYFFRNPDDKKSWGKTSGWTSSGGGGTLLCYTDKATQAKAIEEIKTYGILSDKLIDSAHSIVTHEFMERMIEGTTIQAEYALFESIKNGTFNNDDVQKNSKKLAQMSDQQFFKMVDDKIYAHSPVFGDRLKMLRKLMPRESWVPAKLTPVSDFNLTPPKNYVPYQEFAKECIHWPAVIRIFNFSEGVGNPIKVYFEPRIWNRLSNIDKAILVFHEEIYALQNYMGRLKADDTRELVKKLFSWKYWYFLKSENPDPALRSRIFQSELGPYFGDYYKLFASEVNPIAARGPRATPASWYTSYFLATNQFNDLLKACVGQSKEDIFDRCEQESFSRLLNNITDQRDGEMAFITVTRFHLDVVPGVFAGSEWLLLSHHGDETWLLPAHVDQFKKACHYIQSSRIESTRFQKSYPLLVASARQYCTTQLNK